MQHRSKNFAWAATPLGLIALTGLASNSATAQTVTSYQYDTLGRLTTVESGQGEKSTYEYDKAGNRANLKVQVPTAMWEAETLPHQIGAAEWSGWGASVYHGQGAVTYGPYTNTVAAGSRTAVWRMMTDDHTYAATDTVVVLDVADATTGQVLASRSLTWRSFSASFAYEIFELPFIVTSAQVGHHLEFRTHYKAKAYINVDKVGYY